MADTGEEAGTTSPTDEPRPSNSIDSADSSSNSNNNNGSRKSRDPNTRAPPNSQPQTRKVSAVAQRIQTIEAREAVKPTNQLPTPVEMDDFGLPLRKPVEVDLHTPRRQRDPSASSQKSGGSSRRERDRSSGGKGAVLQMKEEEKRRGSGSSGVEEVFEDAVDGPEEMREPPVLFATSSGMVTTSGNDIVEEPNEMKEAIAGGGDAEQLRTESPSSHEKEALATIALGQDKEPLDDVVQEDGKGIPNVDTHTQIKEAPKGTLMQSKDSAESADPQLAHSSITKAEDGTAEVEPSSGPSEAANDVVVLEDKANNITSQQLQKDPSKRDSLPTRKRDSVRGSLIAPAAASHQQLSKNEDGKGAGLANEDEMEWQEMPSYAPYDIYDDDNKLIAREHDDAEEEKVSYAGMGGAGKGYTRVVIDDDAASATSMDDNTNYLFQDAGGTSIMDDEHQRDAVSQMEATKDLLTEGQRIAYVGLTRLELSHMQKKAERPSASTSKTLKKQENQAADSMRGWAQKTMIRLYSHMDISAAEQVMVEQLAEHGVVSSDLTPQLMANARVNNPMADAESKASTELNSPTPSISKNVSQHRSDEDARSSPPPPAYEAQDDAELPAVRTPSQMPTSDKLVIDLRWTVLCDLFLVLIADSEYDARSRVLLERVAKALDISWIEICRFEKKVTEALEMQQQAERENWNEDEHMESRRKKALNKRYVMMGLATVGGGLVIGLSAGLLAPVIGAGLAAGFTTIGVTGTTSFLAGAGGAAIITSSAATTGGIIGVKAASRRTGAVKTFEYRPLHNNKKVNLIVTVSGWMTGKVDDVRLPYSTVDPVMGDLYSVLWEPEMLTSMGDTINILATEALTQGLQQVLGSTILVGLMAALQLPVVLTKLSYLIDNPWAVSLDRAWSAGQILADSLIERNLGTRPVTLVGYSLGSRVIFSCLLELAKQGAFGLVQNVYIFGSPVVVKQDEYLKIRTIIAGRFVNGYNRNDWILGYLFRLTNGGIRRIAGLAPIEGVPGMENMDVTEFVVGHMDYRTAMPRLLRESGWLVESDEFAEIEDPDPENHTQRQRELINEIEEARKEIAAEAVIEESKAKSKGAFGGFFSRKKKAQKAEWEVYEDALGGKASSAAFAKNGALGSGARMERQGSTSSSNGGGHNGVLFDSAALKAELGHGHELQVKELPSTLPPMKIPSLQRPVPHRTQSVDNGATKAVPLQSVENNGTSTIGTSGLTDRSNGIHDSSLTTRPELTSSQTVPNMMTIKDPWADGAGDHDDDDSEFRFGKEQEISMTFA